ncbi:Na+/H+ antiporter [Actinoalloteichus caeruleus]|uniref:Na+/H+ antiporter n=1 Tax=Actinoalloteichus cyanogriseus TaxID=2893586 RepID=UPI0004BF7F22|nr:Na+/H+ antiporter [Actinoalloteichus caeruleus]
MGPLLVVLLCALTVTAFARRRNLIAPLLLVVVGLAASALPGTIDVEIPPELLLTVVLPPLLYTASQDSSLISFRENFRAIAQLGVLLVIAGTVAVGFLAYALIPGLPLEAALVLGAVVSPPDAVTATAVGRRLRLPRRVMSVIGGESLVNDAAALSLYRVTVAAAVGATGSLLEGVALFVEAAVIGTAVGLLLGAAVHFVRMRLVDQEVSTALSVVLPFGAYLVAEELHGSGVLAVVAAGLYVGHHSPRVGVAGRLQEQQVWKTVNLLLESLVFALIGLYLNQILRETANFTASAWTLVGSGVLVLAAVIVFRVGWLFAVTYVPGLSTLLAPTRPSQRLPVRQTAVIAWTGMRGVVTIAAAGAIPLTTEAGDPFPARELVQFLAFSVTIGTLLLQGLSLPWLTRRLGVHDGGEAEQDARAEVAARTLATRAALRRLDELLPADPVPGRNSERERMAARLRGVIEYQGRAAVRQIGRDPTERGESGHREFVELRKQLLDTQRAALIARRDTGKLADEVLRRILHELDLEEAALDNSWRNR